MEDETAKKKIILQIQGLIRHSVSLLNAQFDLSFSQIADLSFSPTV